MLKSKYSFFVYLILPKIHLQTQYVLRFTFIANYNLEITKTKTLTKHTYTLIHADKQKVY